MTIGNRDLAPGTRLVGSHRQATYVCEVVSTENGGIAFRLEDGRTFSSLSAAGKAVMNGISCNGWRFWSVEHTQSPRARKAKEGSTPVGVPQPKRVRQVKRLLNQRGVPEGEVRWFCSACMKGFLLPVGQDARFCPAGHPRPRLPLRNGDGVPARDYVNRITLEARNPLTDVIQRIAGSERTFVRYLPPASRPALGSLRKGPS